VQAAAPERPITGGMATEALLAHVLVAKYADFLPLYRQAQIFARQGIELDRSTLCAGWAGPAGGWSRCGASCAGTSWARPGSSPTTPLAGARTPDGAGPRRGSLWGYAIDDRPWGGSQPAGGGSTSMPEDRKGEHPTAHLAGSVASCSGRLRRFKRLLAGARPYQVKLAFCWPHCRRGFYELHRATGSPLAERRCAGSASSTPSRRRSSAARR
jgi:hypothetical protein